MKWKAVDIIAAIIAITICIGLVICLIIPIITDIPLSDKAYELVKNIFISIISIVSMYIGAKVRSLTIKRDKE